MDEQGEGTERDRQHWSAVEEAVELMHEERFHEALTNLRDVLLKDGSNPYAYFLLGQALYEVGEVETARGAYQSALVLAPRHLGARTALVHVLRKLGDYREAIRHGMIALEQSPNDNDALYATGMAYLARGDNASARRYLDAFLKTHPEFEIKVEVEAILAKLDPSS